MPKRLIRDGLIDSEAVNSLSCEAERFFHRLLLRADDFGLYHAHPQLLNSYLFPLKPATTPKEISQWLAECVTASIVRPYEAGGKPYLYIPKFGQRLRRKNPSKFPAPPWPIEGWHVADEEAVTNSGHVAADCDNCPPEAGSGSEKRQRESGSVSESGKRNAPTLEEALAYFARLPEADYTPDEVKLCWLSFEANKDPFGQWYWGKRLVGDWRAAMENRMAEGRCKPGRVKQRPESNQRYEKIDPPSRL